MRHNVYIHIKEGDQMMNEQLVLALGLMTLVFLYVGMVTEEYLSLVRDKREGSHETRRIEEGGAYEFHKV